MIKKCKCVKISKRKRIKENESKNFDVEENINKGITISKNGGISRDPNVILQDENVKRLLRLIKENN